MADTSSTATALTLLVASLLYPKGLSANSLSGRRTIVRRGWLTLQDLKGACSLSSGVDYITVMPFGSKAHMHDRPLSCPWVDISALPSNIAATVSGNAVTLTALDNAPLSGLVGVKYLPAYGSPEPDTTVAATAAQTGDTLAAIALRLAQQIPEVRSVGAQLFFDNAREVQAKVSGYSNQARITRRQTSDFCLTVWSGSWQGRDATGGALDTALSDIRFFQNNDPTVSQLSYSYVRDIDAQQGEGVYRRDYIFSVTYDTIQMQTNPTVLWFVGQGMVLSGQESSLFVIGNTRPNTGAVTTDGQSYFIDAAGNLLLQSADPYAGIVLDQDGNVIVDTAGNLLGQ